MEKATILKWSKMEQIETPHFKTCLSQLKNTFNIASWLKQKMFDCWTVSGKKK